MTGRPYGENNIFTFQGGWAPDGTYFEEQLAAPDVVTGYEQYDLGVVEINDEGELATPAQLEQIATRIKDARTSTTNGAIVVGFIHGWHNNADWDNANLLSFRRLLQSLMMRELEALHRRVIGVYLGWNGSPVEGVGRWMSRLPVLRNTTFRTSYSNAGGVGSGEAMSDTLIDLTQACKADGDQSPIAPLIFVGHSMGAYILQSSFRELLISEQAPLFVQPTGFEPVSLRCASLGDVLAPDLLLSLNSAAESEVARDIIDRVEADEWTKEFDSTSVGGNVAAYHPPLLISATSQTDVATNWVWRAGHFFQRASTDGHDASLATHSFAKNSSALADCEAAGPIDFGQPWHCLHKDMAPDPSPRFRIDLPDHDRSGGAPLTHTPYDLVPHDPFIPKPFWLFQVPGEIIDGHSDIFNFKAASFVLALIQASGVLASAAGTSWIENFSEAFLD